MNVALRCPVEETVPQSFALALLASATLSVVIIPSRGHYRPDAMFLVFAALGVVLCLLVDLLRARRAELEAETVAPIVLGVLGVFIASAIVDSRLLTGVDRSWWTLRALSIVELGLLATYARAPSPEGSRWPTIRFALFGVCLLLACIETVRLAPSPYIDVWTVQTYGARALLEGKNPFVEVAVVDTAPGVVRNDVPYVYPPLQVFLTAPGLLLGDVRATMGAALLLTGVSLRDLTLRSGRKLPALLLDAPALLVWLSPKLLFIFQQTWVDPVQIALLCAGTALAARRRVWPAAIVFGLVLASKQTMFWVAPLVFVSFPAFRLRHALVAASIPIATYLPFALWNWPALVHANLGFVAGLPARPDALSFVNWARLALGVHIPYAIAFPLAGTLVGYVMLRRRAQPEIFGVALLLTYFVFFTLNKWTFANYYFSLLAMAALGAAMALHRAPINERSPS